MRAGSTTVRVIAALILSCGTLLTGGARAENKPTEIRIAYPGVGIGNRPSTGGSSTSIMHLLGMLEEEFKKDGIKVTWSFLRGAGPATNELYANKLADFSLLGDLPSLIGKAGGLKTRILAATGIRGNSYFVVPSSSSIQSIKEIKGKRIALFKGTNSQLAANKILEANGLTEKDVRFMNMDTATYRAALLTGDIDGAFGGADLIGLRDQGAVRIVYKTAGDPRYLRHCSFVGAEEFIQKYPEVTQRVVNTLVKAAKWMSDNEQNRSAVFQLWTKSGTRFADYREDWDGQSLKVFASPLLDPYLVSQYKKQVKEAKRFGLIRNDVSVDAWIDARFLQRALKELNLEGYWQPVGEDGAVPGAKTTSAPTAPAAAQMATSL
ncbi:MAG: transporter substrate-binding protein [Myxococcaceae bacterium]|nr:transporter substrate-binding protein [Myxococcaceae bacterium]